MTEHYNYVSVVCKFR